MKTEMGSVQWLCDEDSLKCSVQWLCDEDSLMWSMQWLCDKDCLMWSMCDKDRDEFSAVAI